MAATVGTGGAAQQGLRPLSDEDLEILALECETVAGHTCKVVLLDAAISADDLRASIASRLDAAPELRLRLKDVDGVLHWYPEADVALADHVVADDDSPLDAEALRRRVAELFEERLDRSRPLWRIDVLSRVEGGGSAVVWRIHHALADGTTAMRIAREALWEEPEADAGTQADARGGTHPHPHAADSAARHRTDCVLALARETPQPWLRSPFDGAIDSKRSVAFATADFEGLHRVAKAICGATVNDAVLTVVSGGLRRWLEEHHCHAGAVRVKVPVSLHGADSSHGRPEVELGNRDSFFCLDLPLGPPDPGERLAAIHCATRARKHDHDAERLDALMQELGHASPRLRQFAQHLLASPRSFALNVSNVPGPRRPIRVLGVPARAVYSIAEIGRRHALRISVLSLAGTLRFGLCADPTLLPGVEHLAAAIEDEADALVALGS
jgi:diacylglycerol O-acyltransferase